MEELSLGRCKTKVQRAKLNSGAPTIVHVMLDCRATPLNKFDCSPTRTKRWPK